ncbi:MAG: hypothetical protein QN144_10165 [Armatimonadota bacterium]|nr:hypothetical protein [Armatimonadota bacterium]
MPRKRTKKADIPEAKERFLTAFVERRGDVEEARKDAGIGRAEFYEWLEQDEVFRSRLDSLRVRLAEEIEGEAFRRALNPSQQRGSDALVTTLLKGLRRDRYGDEKGDRVVNVVYISGLRQTPRPGVEVIEDGERAVRQGS